MHQLLCELDTVGGTNNGNDTLHAAWFRVVDGNITGRLSPRLRRRRRRRSYHWVEFGSKVNIPDLLQLASSWSKNGISILGSSGRGGEEGRGGEGGEGGEKVKEKEQGNERGKKEESTISQTTAEMSRAAYEDRQHVYLIWDGDLLCLCRLGGCRVLPRAWLLGERLLLGWWVGL